MLRLPACRGLHVKVLPVAGWRLQQDVQPEWARELLNIEEARCAIQPEHGQARHLHNQADTLWASGLRHPPIQCRIAYDYTYADEGVNEADAIAQAEQHKAANTSRNHMPPPAATGTLPQLVEAFSIMRKLLRA